MNLEKQGREEFAAARKASILKERIETSKSISNLQSALRQKTKEQKELGRNKGHWNGATEVDHTAFLDRIDRQVRQKEEKLERLRAKEDEKFLTYFHPQISEQTQEMVPNRVDIATRTKQLVEKQLEEKGKKKEQEAAMLEEQAQKAQAKKHMSREDVKKAEAVYCRTKDWLNRVQHRQMEQRLIQAESFFEEERVEFPKRYRPKSHTPSSFDERTRNYLQKKELRLEKAEKEMYPYSFTPKSFGRTRQTQQV